MITLNTMDKLSTTTKGNSAGVVERTSEIDRSFQELINIITVAESLVGDLENKLSPVLRSEGDKTEEVPKPNYQTKIATNIFSQAERIDKIVHALRSIHRRTEL